MTIVTVAATDPVYMRKSEGDSIELRDGRLLLIYTEFTGDGSDRAKNRLAAKESADGGMSWGHHRVITTTAPGDMNVYSPNLIRAQDGSILFLFMRQHQLLDGPDRSLYAWKSFDEGATFQPFAEFARDFNVSLCNAVVKRLSSGRLLLPTMGMDHLGGHPDFHQGNGTVLYSDDDGLSWQEADNRLHLPMLGVMEPHLEETRDGRVLLVMRSQLGSLFMSESADNGQSWSKPQASCLRTPESCPEICRIPSTGDLLLIWNNAPYHPDFAYYEGRSHFGKRSPLTAAVSRDEGRSWEHLRDIEDDPTRAFSNPGVRFTRNGTAIVNYWTCEYLPDWCMQDIIDLRVAVIEPGWFYGE